MDYRGHRLSGAHFDTAEFPPQIVIVTELSCVTQTLSTLCRRVDFFSLRLGRFCVVIRFVHPRHNGQ